MPCPWQRKLEASWAGCLGVVNFDQVVQWLTKGCEGVGVRGDGCYRAWAAIKGGSGTQKSLPSSD